MEVFTNGSALEFAKIFSPDVLQLRDARAANGGSGSDLNGTYGAFGSDLIVVTSAYQSSYAIDVYKIHTNASGYVSREILKSSGVNTSTFSNGYNAITITPGSGCYVAAFEIA